MTSLSLSTAPLVVDAHDGRWVVREVSARVELVADGRSLSELVRLVGVGAPEKLATPFEVTPTAGAILAGRQPYAEWLPDPARVPLVLCPCGDLLCGALTVRLTRDEGGVLWSDWAWEDWLHAPRPLPDLPACRFPEHAYDGAVQDAERLAGTNTGPVTRVRVRRPGPWWRNLRSDPEERTDPDTMLGWLHAEAVAPSIGEAEGAFADFLSDLYLAQALLAGAASSHAEPSGPDRDEAVAALTSVVGSPHRISLPPKSSEAACWYLRRFAAD